MMPSKVFITGANGFIGRAVAERFVRHGIEVRGVDIEADTERGIVAGDIADPDVWRNHTLGCDLVIHCAAIVSMSATWNDYRRVTVQGTRNAIEAASNAGCRRFVHISSIAAAGWQLPENADEHWPAWVGDEYRYGVAKAASEHVVLAAHASGEIEAVILRPGDVYGPSARVWIDLVLAMCREDSLVLPRLGEGMFAPLYIDDLVDAIELSVTTPEAAGQIFNITGDEWLSAAEFISWHRRWAGRSGPPPVVTLEDAFSQAVSAYAQTPHGAESGDDLVRLFARTGTLSIEKARLILGYQPKVTFAQGMARCEAHLRANGILSIETAEKALHD